MKIENCKLKIKKGFTLIELILFMGIFSILIFILMDIFITSLKTKTSAEATAVINQDGRFIFSKLSSDINNANLIVFPNLGETDNALDPSDNPFTLNIYGQQETFRVNNGNLELIDATGTYVLNSVNSEVTNLTFIRLGNPTNVVNTIRKNTIKIDLELRSRQLVNNKHEVIYLRTTVGLR